MFIDTSALIAVLAEEEDGPDLALKIHATAQPITSAVVILEASMRLSTMWRLDPNIVRETIDGLLRRTGVTVIVVDNDTARAAVDAFARYGKGRGHKAQLNLADCLSYACAKTAGVPLLYKGVDFARTDLA